MNLEVAENTPKFTSSINLFLSVSGSEKKTRFMCAACRFITAKIRIFYLHVFCFHNH